MKGWILMDYQQTCKFYTQEKIPEVWKIAVEAEKTAEILTYSLVANCLENFSDVYVELDASSPVAKVLMSWKAREQIDFGKHALQLPSPENGKVAFRCIYDIYEIKEDMEMLANDLFGTIDASKVGEKSLFDDNHEIPDEIIEPLIQEIQKRKSISGQTNFV